VGPARPEAGRRLLDLGVEILEHRLQVRTTKGRPMKVSATPTPSGVKATLTPSAASGPPSQPFSA
jgi:hypothetical protein